MELKVLVSESWELKHKVTKGPLRAIYLMIAIEHRSQMIDKTGIRISETNELKAYQKQS